MTDEFQPIGKNVLVGAGVLLIAVFLMSYLGARHAATTSNVDLLEELQRSLWSRRKQLRGVTGGEKPST